MTRRTGRNSHDEHINHERWLLPYADLITLLLGMFVILYGMSKIDVERYMRTVAALGGIFGGQGVLAGTGISSHSPLVAPLTERHRLEQELQRVLQASDKGPITVSQSERGVTVHLKEELLFASGDARLKSSSLATLDKLVSVLRTLPNDIRVEGHTDNVPIRTEQFPSNWHLSVARALNTGYYLIDHHGLDPEKVSIVGYSEYRPLVPNTTADNRARNRRVDIVIVTDLPAGERKQRNG